MQFHHHGYVTTDPRVAPASGTGIDRPAELPEAVDVLIVGAGPRACSSPRNCLSTRRSARA